MIKGHWPHIPVLVGFPVANDPIESFEQDEVQHAALVSRMGDCDTVKRAEHIGSRFLVEFPGCCFFRCFAGIGLAAGKAENRHAFFVFLCQERIHAVKHDGHRS